MHVQHIHCLVAQRQCMLQSIHCQYPDNAQSYSASTSGAIMRIDTIAETALHADWSCSDCHALSVNSPAVPTADFAVRMMQVESLTRPCTLMQYESMRIKKLLTKSKWRRSCAMEAGVN